VIDGAEDAGAYLFATDAHTPPPYAVVVVVSVINALKIDIKVRQNVV
jgi:hypothetical protein